VDGQEDLNAVLVSLHFQAGLLDGREFGLLLGLACKLALPLPGFTLLALFLRLQRPQRRFRAHG
jgi:hypothetical protein